jgi:hypothetical protein
MFLIMSTKLLIFFVILWKIFHFACHVVRKTCLSHLYDFGESVNGFNITCLYVSTVRISASHEDKSGVSASKSDTVCTNQEEEIPRSAKHVFIRTL